MCRTEFMRKATMNSMFIWSTMKRGGLIDIYADISGAIADGAYNTRTKLGVSP